MCIIRVMCVLSNRCINRIEAAQIFDEFFCIVAIGMAGGWVGTRTAPRRCLLKL